MKERTLKSLLEPKFAEGYEAFREFVDYTGNSEGLSKEEKASIRLYELVSVAMVEGLNEVETTHELPPEVTLFLLWGSVGSALATMNGQAFENANGRVRQMTMKEVRASYIRFLDIATEDGPEDRS